MDRGLGLVGRRMNEQYRLHRQYKTFWYVRKTKPQFQKRAEGGMAALVPENGNYRPAITHHTYCVNEKKWRNVAILARAGEGKVWVNCEVCGWQWIYGVQTAANPLIQGVKESFRSTLITPLNGFAHYTAPERGA